MLVRKRNNTGGLDLIIIEWLQIDHLPWKSTFSISDLASNSGGTVVPDAHGACQKEGVRQK